TAAPLGRSGGYRRQATHSCPPRLAHVPSWHDGTMLTSWLSQDDVELEDGGWLNLLTPETLLILGAVLLVLLVVALILGWIVVRQGRRNPKTRRWLVERRTKAQPLGPMREIAEVRTRLQHARSRAHHAVGQAEERGRWLSAPADLPTLARRLVDSAADLDE